MEWGREDRWAGMEKIDGVGDYGVDADGVGWGCGEGGVDGEIVFVINCISR